MAADRIHLTVTPPTHCSSCFQQKIEQPHVDFEAYYDGPSVPALEGVAGAVAHQIDDLILCTDCITAGAALVGLGDIGDAVLHNKDLAATVEHLHGQLEAAHAHIAALEAAAGTRAAVAGARPLPPSRAIVPKPPTADSRGELKPPQQKRSRRRKPAAAGAKR